MKLKQFLQRVFASFLLFVLFALGVQAAGGFIIHKVDETGKPVQGAVFDIYAKPSVTWSGNPTPCIGDPPVEKVVEGLVGGSEEFSFTMKAVDPSFPPVEGSINGEKTVTIRGSGAVEFGNITFTKVGTYDYTIKENDLGNRQYTYDPDVYTVRYVVTNNNGKLESTRTFFKNGVVVSDLEKITFTNVYKGEAKASVSVKKIWDDNNNEAGMRPDNLPVYLYANNEDTGESLILNESNNWKGEFSNLAVKDQSGQNIFYEVKEKDIPGYDQSHEATSAISPDGAVAITYTFTNKLNNKQKITVTKTWDDNNDQDGMRPTSVHVKLNGNGSLVEEADITESMNWIYEFEDMPIYSNGSKIEYTVQEDTVTGYTTTYNGLGITNKHTPETTQINVSKVWDDDYNRDGIRPTSVTVNLLADGTEVAGKTVTLNESNNWKDTFTDLDVYKSGTAISYTVEEVKDSVITGIDGKGTYAINITGDMTQGYVVTNEHTPETTQIIVSKVWDDNNNEAGMRPDNLPVYLYANNEDTGESLILNESNNWKGEFSYLAVKDQSGQDIRYTVEEERVPEYDQSYTETSETGTDGKTITTYTFTNKLNNKQTITVTKTWNDNNDQDGMRPTSVHIGLYGNGSLVEEADITEGMNWIYEFEDMPIYSNGSKIEYTVQEDTVTGYTTTYDGLGITNKHTPETISISGSKEWLKSDGTPADITEDSFTVKVEKSTDGTNWTFVESKEVPARTTDTSVTPNTWTFEDLPKYEDGIELQYRFVEDPVPEGWEASIGDKNNNYTITNTVESNERTITLTKTWKADGSLDYYKTYRPTTTEFANYLELYRNDERISATPTIVQEGRSTYVVTYVVDKYDENGVDYEYKIEEIDIPYYIEGEVTGTMEDGFAVTNTFETIQIVVHKIWAGDEGNEDKRYPTDPSADKNNFFAEMFTISDGENEFPGNQAPHYGNPYETDPEYWHYVEFLGLAKYKKVGAGEPAELIDWEIKEANPPEGYVSSVTAGPTRDANGNIEVTFTNTYDPSATSGVTVNVHFATEVDYHTWTVGEAELPIEEPISAHSDKIGDTTVYKYAYTYMDGTEERTDYYYGDFASNPTDVEKWYDENFDRVYDSALIDNLVNNAILQTKNKVVPVGIFKPGTKKGITVTSPNGYYATHTVNIGEDFTFNIPEDAESGLYFIEQELLTDEDIDNEFLQEHGDTKISEMYQVAVTVVEITKNGDSYDITIFDTETLVRQDVVQSDGSGSYHLNKDGVDTLRDYYSWFGRTKAKVNVQDSVIDITHYLVGIRDV